MLAAPQ